MNANDYQTQALRTATPHMSTEERLLNAVLGISGEAGEVLELVKKARYQGHPLDSYHLAKELGDVVWYIALASDALGISLDRILELNLEKLRKRYPHRFTPDQSMNRKDDDL